MGALLGGILLNSSIQLETDCQIYNWQGDNQSPAVWQPNHGIKTDLAVFTIEQYDLKQQRQWLEAFMKDSEGKGRAVLLSDLALDIKALHELKTLIELKGY